MRVLLVTGKGGVGKTSVAWATALQARSQGQRVALLSADPAHNLGDAIGQKIGGSFQEILPNLDVSEISPLATMDLAWSEVRSWLRNLMRDDVDELLAEELLSFPGIEEVAALQTLSQLDQSEEYDLCVVDCAPTGWTLRMLRFPDAFSVVMNQLFDTERKGVRLLRPVMDGLREKSLLPTEAVFDTLDRLRLEIAGIREVLLDTKRTSVRLVANPTQMVLAETRRAFAYFSLYGIQADALVLNRSFPNAAGSGFFKHWAQREKDLAEELESSFPIPIMRVPLCPEEPRGLESLQEMGKTLYHDEDPGRFFTQRRPLWVEPQGDALCLCIELPGIDKAEVDLARRGNELFVSVRDAKRRIALPRSLLSRNLKRARLRSGVLRVVFLP